MDKDELRKEFPANSMSSKEKTTGENKKQEKEIKKIVTGPVKTNKRPMTKRFLETFIEDDSKNVGNYIFHDVLVPAAKSMICDIVGWGGFAEMLLFKEVKGSRYRNGSRRDGRSYTSYDRASSNYTSSRDRDKDRRDISRSARSRHDFSEITLSTRGEAEEVLDQLVDLTIDYGMASVADYYGFVGIEPAYTDDKWGWKDLSDVKISRVRDGYLIDLPRTIVLD